MPRADRRIYLKPRSLLRRGNVNNRRQPEERLTNMEHGDVERSRVVPWAWETFAPVHDGGASRRFDAARQGSILQACLCERPHAWSSVRFGRLASSVARLLPNELQTRGACSSELQMPRRRGYILKRALLDNSLGCQNFIGADPRRGYRVSATLSTLSAPRGGSRTWRGEGHIGDRRSDRSVSRGEKLKKLVSPISRPRCFLR